MEFGAQHRTERHGAPRRFSIGIVSAVDVLTYAASVMSLAFVTHQIWLIWSAQNAAGVSLVSWIAFTVSHTVWSLYGYVHGEKFIMSVHAVWVLFCVLILIGIVSFS